MCYRHKTKSHSAALPPSTQEREMSSSRLIVALQRLDFVLICILCKTYFWELVLGFLSQIHNVGVNWLRRVSPLIIIKKRLRFMNNMTTTCQAIIIEQRPEEVRWVLGVVKFKCMFFYIHYRSEVWKHLTELLLMILKIFLKSVL